ncbi:MAG: phosphonate C-P lyase system protein PhnG [Azospirillaceae bacterium]|nr:phosphonate C-P lyase system protein PhnG [Azospirillaceae bacterium]
MDGNATAAGATAPRQRWISILARAPLERLETAWQALPAPPGFIALRRPEIGATLVRARAGGSGQRFNLGEMTVTRCTIRLESGLVGHGYVAGRQPRHAELAALFDALLQDPAWHDAIDAALIEPTAQLLAAQRQQQEAKTATSTVTFFTMVRGED